MLLLLLILATSPWGLSKLWDGGVPTSDIDHSRPRIRRLLFRSLINGTAPPSPPSARCPSPPAVVFGLPPPPPPSPPPQDYPPTWASPISVPSYPKPIYLLSLTHHCLIRTSPPLPCPRHACRIVVAVAPPLLPKYFSTCPPVVAPQPLAATTVCTTSPLPHRARRVRPNKINMTATLISCKYECLGNFDTTLFGLKPGLCRSLYYCTNSAGQK